MRRLGEPSLSVVFVKSSARTLAGGRLPTVIVKIKEVSGAGDTGELHILCLFVLLRCSLPVHHLQNALLHQGVLIVSSGDVHQLWVVC